METTESVSTSTSIPASDAPSAGSFVASLLDPANESEASDSGDAGETETEQPGARAAEDGTTSNQQDASALGGVLSGYDPAVVGKWADEMGLDENNPKHQTTLKRWIDQQKYIEDLKSKATTPGSQDESPFLTEFERDLLKQEETSPDKPAAAEQPRQKTALSQERPAEAAPRYGDLGDTWQTPTDSLNDLNKAWTEGNLDRVQEIEVARMRRNFDSYVRPVVMQSISQFVQKAVEDRLANFRDKELGDVLPVVRQSLREHRQSQNKEYALAELQKVEGMQDLPTIFTPIDDTEIEYGGEKFPNTPLNRVLKEYPDIMDINVSHPDPDTAERLSFLKRYRMVKATWAKLQGSIPAKTATQLVNAGVKMHENQLQDRTRQGINAGTGATGLAKASNPSFVSEILNTPDETPFASLFGK